MLTPPFEECAKRLRPDGGWTIPHGTADIGLLFRPIVTQVSRWDRLKGFVPLLEGFVRLKSAPRSRRTPNGRDERVLAMVRLVLAGPDPGSIQDDPEAREVLKEIVGRYRSLTAEQQTDVAIVALPMASPKQNALLVNALQRCSDIVVQNSLQEGFGLTVTEAMWKRAAVLGSMATGLRQQIRPGVEGELVEDPEDPAAIAAALQALLLDEPRRDELGRAAELRVHRDFLVFEQVRRWLELLATTVAQR
jgi:trehalose synthase